MWVIKKYASSSAGERRRSQLICWVTLHMGRGSGKSCNKNVAHKQSQWMTHCSSHSRGRYRRLLQTSIRPWLIFVDRSSPTKSALWHLVASRDVYSLPSVPHDSPKWLPQMAIRWQHGFCLWHKTKHTNRRWNPIPCHIFIWKSYCEIQDGLIL